MYLYIWCICIFIFVYLYFWRWSLDPEYKSPTSGPIINHGFPGKWRIKLLFGHYRIILTMYDAIYDQAALAVDQVKTWNLTSTWFVHERRKKHAIEQMKDILVPYLHKAFWCQHYKFSRVTSTTNIEKGLIVYQSTNIGRSWMTTLVSFQLSRVVQWEEEAKYSGFGCFFWPAHICAVIAPRPSPAALFWETSEPPRCCFPLGVSCKYRRNISVGIKQQSEVSSIKKILRDVRGHLNFCLLFI